MENFLAASTIYKTFLPFNVALCFCGFWFSGTKAKVKHNATLDVIRILMSILFTVLFLALLSWIVYWGEQEPKNTDSFLIKHGRHKLYMIELSFLVILIWSNYRHRDAVAECLHLIDQYDGMSQRNVDWPIKINHRRNRLVAVRSLLMAIVWLIMEASVSFLTRRPEEFTLVRLVSLGCYLITVNITGATFLFHFVFFAASSLNRLGNFIENFELALASHRLDDNSIKALDVFVLSYSTFETLIERINSIFCLQIIFTLFATLSCSVLLIFSLVFDSLREEITPGQLLVQLGSIVWSHTIIIPTVVGIYVAGSIKEKHKHLQRMVAQKHFWCTSAEVAEKLLMFSMRLQSKRFEFSTRLFNFDWTVAFSLFSATCSYLFILLQFEQPGNVLAIN